MNNATQEFINNHRNDNIQTLALQSSRYPLVDMHEALIQIEGWQLAQDKLPMWAATEGVLFPPRISMEQCSSESTAIYKASLINGNSLADMTGGFGIDCSYMSKKVEKAIYIERNETLCNIAKHNFAQLQLSNIEIKQGDSKEILNSLPHCDWIFIDPARRDSAGKKVVALGDCEPDVSTMQDELLKKADNIMIKCSPMLDITAARRELRNISDIHIVAVKNECKELLFILSRTENDSPMIHCINISNATQHFEYKIKEEEQNLTKYATTLARYLYEPNAAIQKSGCNHILTRRYRIEQLHPNSRIYTSDTLIKDFPGRIFEIESYGSFSKNDIKRVVGELRQANITIRNFPENVQTLRKRLKLTDGGETYLFATTLADNSRILIRCRKADNAS